MTVSLPEARSVDHVSKEVRFSHPRRAYPVVGIGLLVFLEALMKMDLALYQALIAINVPEPKAHAVIEALENDMHTLLATKNDLAILTNQIHKDLANLEIKLTMRMGVMLSAAVTIMIAAMKLIN